MNAEVSVRTKFSAHQVGQRTDAHLQASAIGNHLRYDKSNLAVFRARRRRWQLQKWYMVLNYRVYFCHMEQRTSENSWHVFINLNNETLCAPRYGTRIIIPSAECEIAMFVHRRHRNQECIHIDFLG